MKPGILLIGNYPPPFGGVPTHIAYLAPYLVSKGWNVHVLSFEGNRLGERREGGAVIHRPTGLQRTARLLLPALPVSRATRFPRMAFGAPRLYLGCMSIAQMALEIIREHDIGIISAYHLLSAGFAGAVAAEAAGIPLVTTIFGEIYAKPDLYRTRMDAVRFIIEKSARLLSCSSHCAASFGKIGLSTRVDTVYYGIDTARFAPTNDGAEIRRKLGIAKEDPVIIFVGRMVREMGLHTLLDGVPAVLRELPSARYLLVGAKGDLYPRAAEVAAQCPKNVLLFPDLPFEDMPQYVAAANVAAAPSSNDRACLGLAIAEAMATAKPVVACRIGGTAEVVVDGKTGRLVPPESPDALAQALVDILKDSELARAMGREGRRIAGSTFNKDVPNAEMERIFRSLLGSRTS